MQHGPAVRRRKLGEELRALRDRSGLTSGEVARIVGWHQSKISRIETGRSGVKSEDIRLLLDAYGEVVSAQQRALLEALGASAAGPRRTGTPRAGGSGGTTTGASSRRSTGTSSAWRRGPARPGRWSSPWCRVCCRPRSTRGP